MKRLLLFLLCFLTKHMLTMHISSLHELSGQFAWKSVDQNKLIEYLKSLNPEQRESLVKNPENTGFLMGALSYGNSAVIESLFDKNLVNILIHHETPLFHAAEEGNLDNVKKLLSLGADINGDGGNSSPLYSAAHEGHQDIVEELLKQANINVNREQENDPHSTPLWSALEAFKTHKLFQMPGPLDTEEFKKQHEVLFQKYYGIIKSLLAKGAQQTEYKNQNPITFMENFTDANTGKIALPARSIASLLKKYEAVGSPIIPQNIEQELENLLNDLQALQQYLQ